MNSRKLSFIKFLDLFNLRMGIGTFIAVFGAYLCHQYEVIAEYPLSLISIAIVFPIVVSINAAFTRKGNVLKAYAELKGHGTALIFAARDWKSDDEVQNLKPEVLVQLKGLISSIKLYFGSSTIQIDNVYNEFSEFSKALQKLRVQISAGEMSRANQYLSKMLVSFEQIVAIKSYRSSVYLSTYTRNVVFLFPVLYAPYFGNHVAEFHPGFLGYSLPIIYTTVLIALQNVHDLLEDPLNGLSLDDLKFEMPTWEKPRSSVLIDEFTEP